jgi:hypothetical protein
MPMKKRQLSELALQQREASVRDQLGFAAAMRGDEEGVRRFAHLLHSEISHVEFFSGLPGPIKGRLRGIADGLRDLKSFMDGRQSVTTKSK